MRLAIFASGTYPLQTHGAEIGIFYLARELALGGYNVSLHLSEPTQNQAPIEEVDLPKGLKMVYSTGIPLRFIYNFSFLVAALARLKRNDERPDLIAVNIPTLLSLATAFSAKLTLGIRYVVIIHGPPDLEAHLNAIKQLQCLLIQRAAKVVCVSKDLARLAENRCAVEPGLVSTIPNGYDEAEIQAALALAPAGIWRPELAFVGSLNANKDPLTLVRCFKLISESKPDTILNVVGSGPLEYKVRELVAKEHLQSRVVFHDSMKHSELLQLISRSTLLVMTSHQEGLPTVAIEALAMGKPIVATAVGGLPEIITSGRNGFLAPLGEDEILAQQVLMILNNENLRKKLSRQAKESVSNYKWSQIAKQYADVFRSAVESSQLGY